MPSLPAALPLDVVPSEHVWFASGGETPYSRAATEEFELVHNGDKQDDVTVVVGVLHAVGEDDAAR